MKPCVRRTRQIFLQGPRLPRLLKRQLLAPPTPCQSDPIVLRHLESSANCQPRPRGSLSILGEKPSAPLLQAPVPKRLVIASSALLRGLPSAWEWRKKPQMAGAAWGGR